MMTDKSTLNRTVVLTFLALFTAVLSVSPLLAQDPIEEPPLYEFKTLTSGMDEDEIRILDEINAARLRSGAPHLSPNSLLNAVARSHLNRLITRGRNVGEVYFDNGKDIDDWLHEAGYPGYQTPSNRYAPDIAAVVSNPNTGGLTPENIISYWINNPGGITSYRAAQNGTRSQPFFNNELYREIGIAYEQNISNRTRYFVLIFASQRNALPVVVAEQPDLFKVRSSVNRSEVILYIHNEKAYPDGDGPNSIGSATMMRISEQQDVTRCPETVNPPEGWEFYNFERRFTLGAGLGTKTIFVHFCDAFSRMVITKATVNVEGGGDATILDQPTPFPVTVTINTGTLAQPTPDLTITQAVLDLAQTQAAILAEQTEVAATLEAITTLQTPQPTNTLEPPTAVPTSTPEPPTLTATSEPPSATPEPPTSTPEPPSATPEPPTNTSEPPSATLEPPTAVPTNTPEPPTLAPTATTESPTSTPTPTQFVDLAWNGRYMLLRNSSGNRLEINNLRLQSSTGRRLPDAGNWIADVQTLSPGGCLIVLVLDHYSGGTPTPAPADVFRELGEPECATEPVYIGIGSPYAVWALSGRPAFDALYNGHHVAICEPAKGGTCAIPLDGTPPPTFTPEGATSVTVFWNPSVLMLHNSSGRTLDLTNISFSSSAGQFSPSFISSSVMADLDPGTCLRFTRLNASDPADPEDIPCSAFGGDEAVGIPFWRDPNGFTVNVRGTTSTCVQTANRAGCTITIP